MKWGNIEKRERVRGRGRERGRERERECVCLCVCLCVCMCVYEYMPAKNIYTPIIQYFNNNWFIWRVWLIFSSIIVNELIYKKNPYTFASTLLLARAQKSKLPSVDHASWAGIELFQMYRRLLIRGGPAGIGRVCYKHYFPPGTEDSVTCFRAVGNHMFFWWAV